MRSEKESLTRKRRARSCLAKSSCRLELPASALKLPFAHPFEPSARPHWREGRGSDLNRIVEVGRYDVNAESGTGLGGRGRHLFVVRPWSEADAGFSGPVLVSVRRCTYKCSCRNICTYTSILIRTTCRTGGRHLAGRGSFPFSETSGSRPLGLGAQRNQDFPGSMSA